MPAASSSYFSRSLTAGPDSPKVSCTPMRSIFVGHFSERTSATAPPRPPITECSSTVTTLPVLDALFMMRSVSRGLIVWMLITSASIPSSASFLAASSDSLTSRPVAMIVRSFPSLRTTPFPISNL